LKYFPPLSGTINFPPALTCLVVYYKHYFVNNLVFVILFDLSTKNNLYLIRKVFQINTVSIV
jgi:hypothetical protein